MAQPYHICLVDDDRFLLDMYAIKFKTAGHTVTSYQGGEIALDTIRKESPKFDALLVDIVMPAIDGFGVMEAIKSENLLPGTKIIVLSNQGQQGDLDKAKELGAVGYIVKASAIPSEVFTETIKIIETK